MCSIGVFCDIGALPFASFDRVFWINIALISLAASTFANTIYFLGIEKLGAAEVSSFVFFVPFSAIILSALFLDEKLDVFIILGTVLTLYAVKLLNNITLLKRRRKNVE
ncbi:MAG: DMT family transporter [Sulfurospirillum cavolei]|nr:DMT family transporter [Sulfurospirillum cavolei]